MNTPAEEFKRHWEFVHAMTLAFAAEVPDQRWDFSPHPRFAPFSKQLRHVVCVRGIYNDALVSKHADFSRKHSHYSGGLTRDELVRALTNKHDELMAILGTIENDLVIEAFGKQFNFAEFGHVMVQHESIHQGQWSLYATLGGFETPLQWRLNWAL